MRSSLAIIAAAALGAVLGNVIATTQPSAGAPPAYRIVRIFEGGSTTLGVWFDADTGCQYLSFTKSGGLTPRLNVDGTPLCIGPLRSNGATGDAETGAR